MHSWLNSCGSGSEVVSDGVGWRTNVVVGPGARGVSFEAVFGLTQSLLFWRAELLEVFYKCFERGESLLAFAFGVAEGDVPFAFGVDAQMKLDHAVHCFTSFVAEA
jgi:hypothetical protein